MLLVLSCCAGCSLIGVSRNKNFTHTGCATGTKADVEDTPFDEVTSLLTLQYVDGELLVTRTNARMNCSIKEYGLVCDVTIEGNVIHYNVYEKDGPSADCICRVERMSSTVTGLQTGKEYTFDYSCSHDFAPFTFTFENGLNLVRDLTDEEYYMPF